MEFEMKKKFGQNFLTDKNLLAAIVKDAGITGDDVVVEVGPGAGALTKELCKVAKKVIAFEIDKELQPVLEENLSEYNNVEVVFKDIMQVDMADILKKTCGDFKLVANLPYYITTPIIFKFLEECDNILSLTVMVQKEVAEKVVCGGKDQGVLGVMTNFYATTKICRNVSKKMFYPIPKVDSAILRLDIKQNSFSREFKNKFKKVVFASFSMRRKTLSNNLSSLFGSKTKAAEVLTSVGIDPMLRAENLTNEQFIKITNLI